MNQQLKSLMPARAKKFIATYVVNYLLQLLLQRHATTYVVFSQPWLALSPLATFCLGDHAKKVAKGHKAWETPCKLLFTIELKVCTK